MEETPRPELRRRAKALRHLSVQAPAERKNADSRTEVLQLQGNLQ